MPRDLQDPHSARPSIRFAVLELVASDATGDELQFLAALRQIVDDGRSRAADLWEAYHGGATDARARLFARYAD